MIQGWPESENTEGNIPEITSSRLMESPSTLLPPAWAVTHPCALVSTPRVCFPPPTGQWLRSCPSTRSPSQDPRDQVGVALTWQPNATSQCLAHPPTQPQHPSRAPQAVRHAERKGAHTTDHSELPHCSTLSLMTALNLLLCPLWKLNCHRPACMKERAHTEPMVSAPS